MEMQFDRSRWGLMAEFVCQHVQNLQCERPQYARATLGWTPRWFDYMLEKLEAHVPFWVWLHNTLPIALGPAVLVCVSCRRVLFINKFSSLLYHALDYLLYDLIFVDVEENKLKFTVIPDDLGNINDRTWREIAAFPEERVDNVS